MSLSIRNNEALQPYTTLQIGGVAQYFVEVASEASLDEAVGYAQANNLPVTVLGGGSNVLISEQGIQGLVIRMSIADVATEVLEDRVLLTASAGMELDDLVAHAVAHGYWGLENLSHIPGTVGGAPIQNVGAYGVEVQDVIESVRVYNTQARKFQVLTPDECEFEYRNSLFKKPEGAQYIVAAVTFALTTKVTPQLSYTDLHTRFAESQPTLADIRQAVIEIRATKFPNWKLVGTAGSFFKNPILPQEKYEALCAKYPGLPGFDMGDGHTKVPLGWILDKVLHLKGIGNERVGTYQEQALVLINKGDASAEDISVFAEDIIQKVYEATEIEVQWEVTKLGGE